MIYAIQQREMIGNLSGAIYGYEFTGFIGEVYKLFPFPESPSGFKQKPYSTQNRQAVERTTRFDKQADSLFFPFACSQIFLERHLHDRGTMNGRVLISKSATTGRAGGMRKAPRRGHALPVVADSLPF